MAKKPPPPQANKSPTAVLLAGTSVSENAEASVIGNLTASDPNKGDIVTFQVVGVNASLFEAVNVNGLWVLKLKADTSLNYEALTNGTISVDVKATDSGGLSRTETFSIQVADLNEAPSDVSVANQVQVAENTTARTLVADFSVVDPDAVEAWIHNVVSVSDSRFEVTDNGLYLKANQSVDYENLPGGVISLILTATDTSNSALTFSRSLDVNITNVNEAPTLTAFPASAVTEDSETYQSIVTLIKDDVDETATNYDLTDWTHLFGTAYTQNGIYGYATLDTTADTLTYTLDNTDVDTDALKTGDAEHDKFTVTVTDGALCDSLEVDFTVNGGGGPVYARPGQFIEALYGTPDQDIFVFDVASSSVTTLTAIYGFQTGFDRIAWVNTSVAEAPNGFAAVYGPFNGSGDFSSQVPLDNDPNIADGSPVLHVWLDVNTFGYTSFAVRAIDAQVLSTDLVIYPNDPFLVL